ncbi:unnamed protein product [Albugo candida]|uniref:Uncharacterized protein n=1 Tax=Albugo candida TaxID=65357 RepID=A0A024GIS0_9STRA|nr:unnamed protein product [Albugo candida]|eukprot:CCI46601.1 unnamed protein product [Albugo candida]
MRNDSKRIPRAEFNSTDAQNRAIEKENAHPSADGNHTNFKRCSSDSGTHTTRLPAMLRSLVLNYLIHDEKISSNHQHVCKLKAPFTQSGGK